jgi:hypothetical protein
VACGAEKGKCAHPEVVKGKDAFSCYFCLKFDMCINPVLLLLQHESGLELNFYRNLKRLYRRYMPKVLLTGVFSEMFLLARIQKYFQNTKPLLTKLWACTSVVQQVTSVNRHGTCRGFCGYQELGGVYSHDFFNFSINYTLRTESIKEYESLKGGWFGTELAVI